MDRTRRETSPHSCGTIRPLSSVFPGRRAIHLAVVLRQVTPHPVHFRIRYVNTTTSACIMPPAAITPELEVALRAALPIAAYRPRHLYDFHVGRGGRTQRVRRLAPAPRLRYRSPAATHCSGR